VSVVSVDIHLISTGNLSKVKLSQTTMNTMLHDTSTLPPTSPLRKYDKENDHATADPFESNDEDTFDQNPALKRLRIIAAQSGFIMSLLAQFATVGIYFLLRVLVSPEGIQRTKLDYLVSPLATCVLDLILAIGTLSVLHDLAAHEYYNAHPERSTATKENMKTDKELQEVFHDVNMYFILGAVTGISLLWTSMDFFMGWHRQFLFSASVLVMASVCLIMPPVQTSRNRRTLFSGEGPAYCELHEPLSERNDSSYHLVNV